MKTQLLALMLVSHIGYAHAKEDLASTLNAEGIPLKSHSIDFIDKNLKLTLTCSVGDLQPSINVTMSESFAFNGDPSVLIITSGEQTKLKLHGTGSLMNFSSGSAANPDLWASLGELQAQQIHLEAVSFRSSKYTSADLVAVGFADAVVRLKQDCAK
ncbi:MAG: hypothetical protein KJ560_02545 [Gammaproteobacteria bacterium]|nr:hypothetical protein [Gammaproteobacteria bacterium]